MNDHEAKLVSYLHGRGLKFTRQRRTVMQEVFASHEHFEADELLQRMRKRNLRDVGVRAPTYDSVKRLRRQAKPGRETVCPPHFALLNL